MATIFGKPALVADEDSGVIVVPVGEGVAAGPSSIDKLVRPLWIGGAGAVNNQQFKQVVDRHAAIVVQVGGDGATTPPLPPSAAIPQPADISTAPASPQPDSPDATETAPVHPQAEPPLQSDISPLAEVESLVRMY